MFEAKLIIYHPNLFSNIISLSNIAYNVINKSISIVTSTFFDMIFLIIK